MNAVARAVVGAVLLVVPGITLAAGSCTGVLDYDEGAFSARFRCRFAGPVLRRVVGTCRDGAVGCDADGACNGACTFAVCTDETCTDTFGVTVPLRRSGQAKGRAVVRAGRTRLVLRCLPPHGGCSPTVSTTTTTTTSTTLPARPCRATLSRAVSGAAECTATFSIGGLGLPALVLRLDGIDVAGQAAFVLTSSTAGTYRLGEGVVLAVLALIQPRSTAFQATQPREGQVADVVLETVVPGRFSRTFEAHGSIDATLAGPISGEIVRLTADF